MIRKISGFLNRHIGTIIWLAFLGFQVFMMVSGYEPRPIDVLTPAFACVVYSTYTENEGND